MVIDAAPRNVGAPPLPPRRPGLATTALGLLVATTAGGALAIGLAMRALSLATGSEVRTVDALLEVAVCGVGALVASWLAVSAFLALGCLAVRLVGSSWRAGERLVHRCAPAVVRRALVLVVGATVGLGAATGASAVAPSPSPSPSEAGAPVSVTADDLGWIVTTPTGTSFAGTSSAGTTPSGTASTATPAAPSASPPAAAQTAPDTSAAAPSRTPPPTTPGGGPVAGPSITPAATGAPAGSVAPAAGRAYTVVVVAGDSLWAIAARQLAPDATDAEIAASWPQWYRANSAVIGSDPGLIVPGQQLTAPVAQDGTPS